MIINRGNEFDYAMYKYGLVLGVKYSSKRDCPQILGEELYDYVEHVSAIVLRRADTSIQEIMLQAKGGLENLIDGLYDSIKSVIEPQFFSKSLLDSAKEIEGIKD